MRLTSSRRPPYPTMRPHRRARPRWRYVLLVLALAAGAIRVTYEFGRERLMHEAARAASAGVASWPAAVAAAAEMARPFAWQPSDTAARQASAAYRALQRGCPTDGTQCVTRRLPAADTTPAAMMPPRTAGARIRALARAIRDSVRLRAHEHGGAIATPTSDPMITAPRAAFLALASVGGEHDAAASRHPTGLPEARVLGLPIPRGQSIAPDTSRGLDAATLVSLLDVADAMARGDVATAETRLRQHMTVGLAIGDQAVTPVQARRGYGIAVDALRWLEALYRATARTATADALAAGRGVATHVTPLPPLTAASLTALEASALARIEAAETPRAVRWTLLTAAVNGRLATAVGEGAHQAAAAAWLNRARQVVVRTRGDGALFDALTSTARAPASIPERVLRLLSILRAGTLR